MSGYTAVGAECLYSYYGAATTSTPTASPGGTITAACPPIVVPANYFKNVGSWSSSIRLMMGGLMTATATIPTWQFICYAALATTTAPAFATTGISLWSTNAIAPSGAVTNASWGLDVHTGLRTLALGAASTLASGGDVNGVGLGSAVMSVPATGAYSPPSTWDTTQAYILWPALILGSATSGNTVTVQYIKLYGEN